MSHMFTADRVILTFISTHEGVTASEVESYANDDNEGNNISRSEVTKALLRLHRKGLITGNRSAWRLTPHGEQVLGELRTDGSSAFLEAIKAL